jgi:hypothetical protein
MELLSKNDASLLAKELSADAVAAPKDIKDIFCKAWPLAKQAIEAAIAIIKNPIVLVVLKAADAVGDALFSALGCPK